MIKIEPVNLQGALDKWYGDKEFLEEIEERKAVHYVYLIMAGRMKFRNVPKEQMARVIEVLKFLE